MLNSQSMLLKMYDYCKPHAKISSYDQFAAKSVKAISLSCQKQKATPTDILILQVGRVICMCVCMQQMMQENRGSTKKWQFLGQPDKITLKLK